MTGVGMTLHLPRWGTGEAEQSYAQPRCAVSRGYPGVWRLHLFSTSHRPVPGAGYCEAIQTMSR